MDEILKVHTEFFEMPMEEKMKYFSDDVRAPFKYGVGQVATSYHEQAWKDHLTLLYKEEMDTSNWPKVPARFVYVYCKPDKPCVYNHLQDYKNKISTCFTSILQIHNHMLHILYLKIIAHGVSQA